MPPSLPPNLHMRHPIHHQGLNLLMLPLTCQLMLVKVESVQIFLPLVLPLRYVFFRGWSWFTLVCLVPLFGLSFSPSLSPLISLLPSYSLLLSLLPPSVFHFSLSLSFFLFFFFSPKQGLVLFLF